MMNIIELKTKLHYAIDKINDESILEAHLLLLEKEVEVEQEEDFWDSLDDPTKTAIAEGLADLKAGRKENFFEFMKKNYGIRRYHISAS
jgi:hypothetical protein